MEKREITEEEKLHELNALIALKVMGWKWKQDHSLDGRPMDWLCWFDEKGDRYGIDVKDFAGSIADAWLVVEKMRERGWSTMTWSTTDNYDECAMINSSLCEHRRSGEVGTMPLQICRCALACVDAKAGE